MTESPIQDVFELVLARPVDTAAGEHAALVHLWWRAPQQGDHLVQVYVDDNLYDVTLDTQQRDLWLLVDRTGPHRIELLAIDRDTDDTWQAHPALLQGWQPKLNTRAQVIVLRDERLPVDTTISVTANGVPIVDGLLWPAGTERSGFGGLFGVGGFGFDDAAGPGLGRGELGLGPLGRDGDAWRWQRDDFAHGMHTIHIDARDAAGQQVVTAPAQFTAQIDPLPQPARQLQIAGDFTLTWQ